MNITAALIFMFFIGLGGYLIGFQCGRDFTARELDKRLHRLRKSDLNSLGLPK